MAHARILLSVACLAVAGACSENDTRMAGDDPLADAREATQPSPPLPQGNPSPSEPYGGLPKQPVVIPTNPPETAPPEDSNH